MIAPPLPVPDGVTLPLALSLGLLYGLGPCLLSCLPALAPVFLHADGGVRRSWRILLPLSAGRLTVYSGFGAISGWWGSRYVAGVAPEGVGLATGLAMLLVGTAILLRRREGCGPCQRRNTPADSQPLRGPLPKAPADGQPSPASAGMAASHPVLGWGLYLMGVSMALSPCVPLSGVLIAAAASGDVLGGALLGVSFGLGALVGPSLAYGLGLAYFGQQLRRQLKSWLPRLEALTALLFILIGARQAVTGLL
ncbi:MAG TPA: sulfite exporter TauE/SafE family protein [Rhodocyclaceae bacterium]|nr:sulfite exporter TauE/SafE family protein [Rhodocyclaceae bacterium]